MSDVRAHIVVSGIVQGVGYRFFVLRLARKLQLTGWVKNVYTGQVEIMAEGSRGLIESFIQDLRTGNARATVTEMDVRWETFSGKYQAFDVTF